jgi:uncharacterized membrane protein YgcG
MSDRQRLFLVGAVLVAGLIFAGQAAAVAPEIKDDGKFFSPDTIKKANKLIREIARKYERDLLVETYAAVPMDQVERVKGMSRDERERFFRNWATDRAEATVVHGVYILVCKEPTHLEIIITAKARSVFDKDTFDKLRELLLKHFREKHYDEGLLAAVDFVRDKLAGAANK